MEFRDEATPALMGLSAQGQRGPLVSVVIGLLALVMRENTQRICG